jgi:SAM-dependent methyltransferase
VDEGPLRALRFGSDDGADQSLLDLRDPTAVPMEYLRPASLSLLVPALVRRVLIVGLGAGSFASLVRRQVPTARVDGVEIDPVVVDVAERFFGLEVGPRLVVHVQDGARFIHERKVRRRARRSESPQAVILRPSALNAPRRPLVDELAARAAP